MAKKRLNQAYCALIAVVAVLFAAPARADDIADHIVVSEVLILPAVGQAPFIELYNPTDQEISLDAYFLRSDLRDEYPALSGSIPADGFYLVSTSEEGWPESWPVPDLVAPMLELGAVSGGVALIGGGETVDMLGWGISPRYYETTPCNAPDTGDSLERKSGSSHDDGDGNGYDTDNNIFDFHVRGEPEPQNTASDIERPPSSAGGVTWGFLKDLFGPQL
ncbi:MAG TPA: lamin tail domain-containing protein [bacterium]|nr:lamin tail domain-containing protein [bacterium]